jgi:hypothetical protein
VPDQPMMSPDLAVDLRRYFAITAGTELPRVVREMSTRTLGARRRSFTPLFAGGGALVAAAALVFAIVALPHGGTTSGSGSTYSSAALANPGSTISYPGVDGGQLAQAGDVLLLPAGHGTAQLTAAQAQAAAVASQVNAEVPGPAVLAWAQVAGTGQTGACLCWVVDVPIRGGVANGSYSAAPLGSPPAQTVLVLVDATTGRIFATLSAPGIP